MLDDYGFYVLQTHDHGISIKASSDRGFVSVASPEFMSWSTKDDLSLILNGCIVLYIRNFCCRFYETYLML